MVRGAGAGAPACLLYVFLVMLCFYGIETRIVIYIKNT